RRAVGLNRTRCLARRSTGSVPQRRPLYHALHRDVLPRSLFGHVLSPLASDPKSRAEAGNPKRRRAAGIGFDMAPGACTCNTWTWAPPYVSVGASLTAPDDGGYSRAAAQDLCNTCERISR